MLKEKNKNRDEAESATNLNPEIVGALTGLTDLMGHSVDNQSDMLGLVKFIFKTLNGVFFILGVLLWKVFFEAPALKLFSVFGERWTLLQIEYKVLILGIFGAVLAGVVSNLLSHFLLGRLNGSGSK